MNDYMIKNNLSYLYYLIVIFIFIFLLLLPNSSEQIVSIIPIFCTIPGLVYLLRNQKITVYINVGNYNHLLSRYYFFIFFVYLLIGSLNYLAIKYFYPSIGGNLLKTNIYTSLSFYTALIGYLIASRKKKYKIYNYKNKLKINLKLLTIFFFIIGTIGCISIIFYYNGIPIISKRYIGAERFIGNPELRSDKLIYFLVFSAMLSFSLLINNKEKSIKNFYYIIFVLSIIQLPIMAMRFPLYITLSGCFFLYILNKKIYKKQIIIFIILFIGFILLNLKIKELRENKKLGISNSYIKDYKELILNDFIPFSFNEYSQLVLFMEVFNDYKYGETLLNIPISFIPYYILELFNINKKEIRKNNSAYILQMILSPNGEGTGLRSGIMGEFYVNFGYFGFLFMSLLGYFLGLLELRLNKIQLNNFQIVILILLYLVLIYSFVGQIDGIGGIILLILFVNFIVNFLSKKVNHNLTNKKLTKEIL